MASNPPNNSLPFIPNADSSANNLFAFHRMMSYQHLLAAQQLINYLYPNVVMNNELLAMLLTNQMTIGTALFGTNVGTPELPTTSSTISDLNVPNTSAPPSTLPVLKSGNGDVDVDSPFSHMDALDGEKVEKQPFLLKPYHFTAAQSKSLHKLFAKNHSPSNAECEILGSEIGLTPLQIRNWFKRQRNILREKSSQLRNGSSGQNSRTRSSPLPNYDNAKRNLNLDSTLSHRYGKRSKKLTAAQKETLKECFKRDGALCISSIIKKEPGLTTFQIKYWYGKWERSALAYFGSDSERQPTPIQKTRKKSYPRFTEFQSETLHKYFSNDPNLSSAQRKVIEEETGLTNPQITTWYRNRRCLLKKKESERLVKEEKEGE